MLFYSTPLSWRKPNEMKHGMRASNRRTLLEAQPLPVFTNFHHRGFFSNLKK